MACCDACATGNDCSCNVSEAACQPCKPYSARALELLRQDTDPSTVTAIPPATTGTLIPPARGGAVYNYSCARYVIKSDQPLGFLTGIRWVSIIDPTAGGANARQEGLNARTGNNFLCGDDCKSFPVDAEVVGSDDIEILQLEVTNGGAAAANVTLELYGRALCVPMYQPIPGAA